MIKVGILGCGKVADQHAEAIQRIPGCEIVAACDSEILMAKQLHERFKVKQYFSDITKFLDAVSPGIVHITTPPQLHFQLGKLCIKAGCHVYMEKPFTLDAKEARELIQLAVEKKLKITVNHNYQFNHVARDMRCLIQNGYLGGKPVHMDSYYCYNLGDEGYAKALLGDKEHWVRKLPGKLLHNIINHGVARIVEYLSTENPTVIAHGFTSPLLKSINESEIIDEIRVIIADKEGSTGYFTFSSQILPILHQFYIYGPKNSLFLDENQQILVKHSGLKFKSYLNHFIPPLEYSGQYFSNFTHNVKKFMKRDFHMNAGLGYLIHSFYRSVADDVTLPISYREILLTTKIMDDIFDQLNAHNKTQ